MIHLFLFFTYSKIRCSEGTHFIDKHTFVSRKQSVVKSFYTKNYFFQQVTDEQQNVQ